MCEGVKIIMNYLFVPLKPVLHNLDKNVCFMEIDDKYSNIRISCDWCSICNGIVETAKSNIVKNPKLVKRIDFENLKIYDKQNLYNDLELIKNEIEPGPDNKGIAKGVKEISSFCKDSS